MGSTLSLALANCFEYCSGSVETTAVHLSVYPQREQASLESKTTMNRPILSLTLIFGWVFLYITYHIAMPERSIHSATLLIPEQPQTTAPELPTLQPPFGATCQGTAHGCIHGMA